MEVETLRLLSIVRHVSLSNNPQVIWNLENLLDESPVASNYIFETVATLVWFESHLVAVKDTFGSSTVPLRRHVEVGGLTAQCKVRISENQAERIVNLIRSTIF